VAHVVAAGAVAVELVVVDHAPYGMVDVVDLDVRCSAICLSGVMSSVSY
jgi:hypothetical protein